MRAAVLVQIRTRPSAALWGVMAVYHRGLFSQQAEISTISTQYKIRIFLLLISFLVIGLAHAAADSPCAMGVP